MKIDDILNLQNEEEIILKIGEMVWEKTQYDYDNFSNLNEIEKTFIFVDILEAQVNNGGFDQFFFNSSGDFTYEVLEAYENIGAYKTAKIIIEAIKLFPKVPVSKDTETRRIIMQDLSEEISEKWNQLDDQFYKYEENIVTFMIDYIKKKQKNDIE